MKQFFINIIGFVVILFVFIYDLLFNKDIKKLNNPDPDNIYNPEDL